MMEPVPGLYSGAEQRPSYHRSWIVMASQLIPNTKWQISYTGCRAMDKAADAPW